MGDYIVRNSQLMSLQESYSARNEELSSSFQLLDSAVKGLVGCQGFQGNAASNMRAYMTSTYGRLTGLMGQLSTIISARFTDYVGKYTAMDSDYAAFISTSVLTDVRDKVEKDRQRLEEAQNAFIAENGKLHTGDVRFGYSTAEAAEALQKATAIGESLADTVKKINTIEEEDIKKEFSTIESLLTALEELLDYQSKLDPTKPFDAAGYQRKLAKVGLAYTEAVKELEARKADLRASAQRLQEMKTQKAQDEYEERRKKAALIGFIVDAACAVVTVAATATLGPVGTIVTGAITGMVKSAVHEGLDQYAETGCSFGDLDWGRIGIKAAVGGTTGALTSAIGVGFGNVSSAIGTMGGTFAKGMAKVGASVLQNEANMLVDHLGTGMETYLTARLIDKKDASAAWREAGDAFVENLGKDALVGLETGITSHLSSAVTGGMDPGFGKSILKSGIDGGVEMADYAFEQAVSGKEIDTKEMLSKGVRKGTSSLVKSGFSDLTSDNFPLKQWEEKQGTFKTYSTEILVGGISSGLSEACGGYVSDRLINGKTASEAFKGNFSLRDEDGLPSSALKKGVEGATEAFGKTYRDRHTSTTTVEDEEISDREFRKRFGHERGADERGTRTVEYDEKGQKIVTYSRTTTETNPDKSTTETTEGKVYQRGKQIGTTESTRTTGKSFYQNENGEYETEVTTDSRTEYTKRDGTVVSEERHTEDTRYAHSTESRVHQEDSIRKETAKNKDKNVRITHSETKDDGTQETTTTEREKGHKGSFSETVTREESRQNDSGGKDVRTETTSVARDKHGRTVSESGSSSEESRDLDGDSRKKESAWSYDRKAREASRSETSSSSTTGRDGRVIESKEKISRDYQLDRHGETKKVTDTYARSRIENGETDTRSTSTETRRKYSDGEGGAPRFGETSAPKTDRKITYETSGKEKKDPAWDTRRKAVSKAGGEYKPPKKQALGPLAGTAATTADDPFSVPTAEELGIPVK